MIALEVELIIFLLQISLFQNDFCLFTHYLIWSALYLFFQWQKLPLDLVHVNLRAYIC